MSKGAVTKKGAAPAARQGDRRSRKDEAPSHKRRPGKARPVAEEGADGEAPRTRKEVALQKALVATLVGRPSASAPAEPDSYGKGSPTDRLMFGYSPAVTDEAVAFHSRITAEDWIAQRRANGRVAFVKHQKLPKSNCEPLISLLKLKNHWKKVSKFQSGLRGDHISAEDADELIEMLAAKQRVDPAQGV